MIVVIEGHRQTGKSTLGRALWEDLELPQEAAGELYSVMPAAELIPKLEAQPNWLLTRFHIEQYAELSSREEFDARNWSLIDNWLARRRAFLLLLVETPFVIEKRMQELYRSNQVESRAQIGDLLKRYDEAFRASSIGDKGRYRLTQFFDTQGQKTAMYWRLVEQLKGQIG